MTVTASCALGADNYPFILFRIKIKYLRCLFVVDIPCNTSSHPDKKTLMLECSGRVLDLRLRVLRFEPQ